MQDLAGVHREFDETPEDEKYLKLLLALELQIAAAGSDQTGELVKRWSQAVDLLPKVHPEHVLGWARYLNERCPHFCGRNRELVERMLEIGQTLAPVLRQARKAAEDPALPALLQGLAGLAHDSILDHQGTRAQQHRVAHGEMLESAAGMPAATVQKAVAALRSRYPDLARNREAWLSEVLAVAGSRAPDQGGARGACGCLFLLFLVVMLVSAVG